jgi:hypothetical protein
LFDRQVIYQNTVAQRKIFINRAGPFAPMADRLTQTLFKFGATRTECAGGGRGPARRG